MDQDKIWVTVRKRPLTRKERRKKDYDTISWIDDKRLVVRERKRKLDLTKYIETHPFRFDQVYSENTTNSQIYSHAVQPLVKAAFTGTKVTWFAYGQTGSGKTYTMLGEAKHPGLYLYAANDIFSTISKKRKNLVVQVSFYEIYCGKLYDLLHKRQELVMREDASQTVNIVGLKQRRVNSVEQLMGLIELGQSVRASGTTGANDDSSRSHAVLQIQLQDGSQLDDVQPGRITFIDLAGSERGADVVDWDKQTRIDGSEINKSLLALKECIRALDQDKKHTPFRGSKLTQVLKDSLTGNARTLMIAAVSPAFSNCEHTLNTLRYADRVKEMRKAGVGPKTAQDVMMLKPQTLHPKLSPQPPRRKVNVRRKSESTIKIQVHQKENISRAPSQKSQKSKTKSTTPLKEKKVNSTNTTQLKSADNTEDELVTYHRQYVAVSMENLQRQTKLLKFLDKKIITKEAYVAKLISMMSNTDRNVQKLQKWAMKHRGNLKKDFSIS